MIWRRMMRIQTDATAAPHFTSTTQRRLLHLLRGEFDEGRGVPLHPLPETRQDLLKDYKKAVNTKNGPLNQAPVTPRSLLGTPVGPLSGKPKAVPKWCTQTSSASLGASSAAASDTASSSSSAPCHDREAISTQTPHRNRRLRGPSRRWLQHVKSSCRCSFACLQLK
jgi:hypothetical protein